jgi:hypothetical protein
MAPFVPASRGARTRFTGSAIYYWDTGPIRPGPTPGSQIGVEPPPYENLPNRLGEDPHGAARAFGPSPTGRPRGALASLRYRVAMPRKLSRLSRAVPAAGASDAATASEAVRNQRLREDAQRSMAANLAETIALSHAYIRLAEHSRL